MDYNALLQRFIIQGTIRETFGEALFPVPKEDLRHHKEYPEFTDPEIP